MLPVRFEKANEVVFSNLNGFMNWFWMCREYHCCPRAHIRPRVVPIFYRIFQSAFKHKNFHSKSNAFSKISLKILVLKKHSTFFVQNQCTFADFCSFNSHYYIIHSLYCIYLLLFLHFRTRQVCNQHNIYVHCTYMTYCCLAFLESII
jgi:hypothetical protein